MPFSFGPQGRIYEPTQEEQDRLALQISDPQHVYIESAPGAFICHKESIEETNVMAGDRIRFTRLSAERMLKSFHLRQAKLVPCY